MAMIEVADVVIKSHVLKVVSIINEGNFFKKF